MEPTRPRAWPAKVATSRKRVLRRRWEERPRRCGWDELSTAKRRQRACEGRAIEPRNTIHSGGSSRLVAAQTVPRRWTWPDAKVAPGSENTASVRKGFPRNLGVPVVFRSEGVVPAGEEPSGMGRRDSEPLMVLLKPGNSPQEDPVEGRGGRDRHRWRERWRGHRPPIPSTRDSSG